LFIVILFREHDKMLQKIDERPRLAKALTILEDHGVALQDVLEESCCVEENFEPIAVPVYNEVRRLIQKSDSVVTFAKLFAIV